MKLKICVISANRWERVGLVQEQFPNCIWYVPKEQVDNYKTNGARKIFGVKGKLPMKAKQNNVALEREFGRGADVVALVEDDLISCVDKNSGESVPANKIVKSFANRLMDQDKFFMIGPSTSSNKMWMPETVAKRGKITGIMMVIKKSEYAYFDSKIKGSEDVDYCMQQHLYHGGMFVSGEYIVKHYAQHLKKPMEGGWVSHRTMKLVNKTAKSMEKKWSPMGITGWFGQEDPLAMLGPRVPWKKIAEKLHPIWTANGSTPLHEKPWTYGTT